MAGGNEGGHHITNALILKVIEPVVVLEFFRQPVPIDGFIEEVQGTKGAVITIWR